MIIIHNFYHLKTNDCLLNFTSLVTYISVIYEFNFQYRKQVFVDLLFRDKD